MLSATINAKALKRIVNIVRGTCDEAVFQIGHDQIVITVKDPKNAHLTDIRMPLLDFEVYEASPHRIGVDIDNLWNKIKSAKPTATIHISEESENGEPIRLLLKIGNSTFGVRLVDVGELPKILIVPTVELSAVVSYISGSVIKQLVKDAKDVFPKRITPEVSFITDGTGTFTASAKYTDTYKLELDNSSVGVGRAKYGLEYLNNVAMGIEDKDIVNLSFGDDLPLKIDFTIGNCEIVQWLAARVERADG